jgi:hypothetical protein
VFAVIFWWVGKSDEAGWFAAGTARVKEVAEKVAALARSVPQELKRTPLFSGLAARVELVPFPNPPCVEFFPLL